MATAADSPGDILGFRDLYRAGPVERIKAIRAGVLAREIKSLSREFGIDQAVMFKALGLKTATVNRKAAQGETLAPDESERVLGLAKLIGQVQAMVEESGDPEGFNAAAWLAQWLRRPVPALGGIPPIEYLDTMEGQAVVARTLAQMQSGAYA